MRRDLDLDLRPELDLNLRRDFDLDVRTDLDLDLRFCVRIALATLAIAFSETSSPEA